MVRIILFFIFNIIILNTLSADVPEQFVDNKLAENRYSVIYIEMEETSDEDARQRALQHAAEWMHRDGYRYFTLDSEQEVSIAQGQGPDQPYQGNMYEELIIQRDFGKSSIDQRTSPSPINTYPGLKIVVSGYSQKPSAGKVYDVCGLISCSGR